MSELEKRETQFSSVLDRGESLKIGHHAASQVSVSSVLIPKKCAKCRPSVTLSSLLISIKMRECRQSGEFVVFAYFKKMRECLPVL
jgi:hypothetical protein